MKVQVEAYSDVQKTVKRDNSSLCTNTHPSPNGSIFLSTNTNSEVIALGSMGSALCSRSWIHISNRSAASNSSECIKLEMCTSLAVLYHKVLFFIKDSFPKTHKLTVSNLVSFYKCFPSRHLSSAAAFQGTEQPPAK